MTQALHVKLLCYLIIVLIYLFNILHELSGVSNCTQKKYIYDCNLKPPPADDAVGSPLAHLCSGPGQVTGEKPLWTLLSLSFFLPVSFDHVWMNAMSVITVSDMHLWVTCYCHRMQLRKKNNVDISFCWIWEISSFGEKKSLKVIFFSKV